MMMSLLERLNHAFSGGIMFVQPTAEIFNDSNVFFTVIRKQKVSRYIYLLVVSKCNTTA